MTLIYYYLKTQTIYICLFFIKTQTDLLINSLTSVLSNGLLGKSLQDKNQSLLEAGIKKGSKVMILGKKVSMHM